MINEQKIKEIMSTFLNMKPEELTNDKVLLDCVAESFVLIQMLMSLQDQLEIILNQEDIQDVQTVGDLVKVIQDRSPT